MFNNRNGKKSISNTITVGILKIALLSSIVIGLSGIVSLAVIDHYSSQTYEQNMLPLSNAFKAEQDLLNLRLNTRNRILNPQLSASYAQQNEALYSDLQANIGVFERSLSSRQEEENSQKLEADLQVFKSSYDAVTESIDSGNNDAAVDALFSSSNTASTQVDNDITKEFSINNEQAQQRNEQSSVILYTVIGAIAMMVLLTVLLTVKTGRKLALGISVPIGKLVEAAESISKGRLDVTLDLNTEDETKVLAQAFRTIVESLRRLEEDVSSLISAALKGELEIRAETGRHEGDYRTIIEGINRMLDTVKEPLDVSAVFISNLSGGVRQQDIENRYEGYYHHLVANLNEVRHSMEVLLEESEKLEQAGAEGNLGVRGDESRLKGFYAGIVHGVNLTLDSVIEPLQESRSVLAKMSENDFTLEMSPDYNGMLKDLADSINLVRTRLLSTQDALTRLGAGDLSRLAEFKKIGKRSENDRIMPAIYNAYQTIQNLIDSSNGLADAAYEGRLEVHGDAAAFTGGYRSVIEGMNRMMDAVNAPIQESSRVLQELAEGDLTVSMKGDYQGSYNQIKDGLNRAIESFNVTLTEIAVSSDQVAASAKQVSDASQSLSQGTTEQASSLEELTSSVTEISAQTRENAENAAQVNQLSTEAKSEALQGTDKMNLMLQSMQEISESSANISKINKVIDDIAFQTNILALNAAVEAARAGQYGKGFAVVAEEVRNLAAKSAEAAKETTSLIEGSLGKVEHGTRIANETAGSLSKITESVQKVTVLVGNIAAASNDQATAIAQIDQGLGQVAAVVQVNSSTAEESAASSEELSGQADTLRKMVAKFVLKENRRPAPPHVVREAAAEKTFVGLNQELPSGKY